MHKIVTIQLGGLILHLEEEALQRLNLYLNALNVYFLSQPDGIEVFRDIEARIAEKLYQIQASKKASSLVLDDILRIEQEIGQPSDFEQADAIETSNEIPNSNLNETLKRVKTGAVIGGVAQGVATYLNIEVAFVRLIFVASILLGGLGILTYGILWFVLPANIDVQSKIRSNKLYRNGSKKVIGGVASGLASYLNTDIALIRILFIIAIPFGGVGFIVYLLLWLAMPLAKSPVEKVEMHGQAVSLSALNQNPTSSTAINHPLIKVLRAPLVLLEAVFRLIGLFLNSLIPILKFCLGIITTAIGSIFMIGLASVLAVYLFVHTLDTPIPLSTITSGSNSLDVLIVFALSAIIVIPAILLIYSGIYLLFRKKIFSLQILKTMFWVLGGSMVALFLSGVLTATQFSKIGKYTTVAKIPTTNGILDLAFIENENNDDNVFIPTITLISNDVSKDTIIIQQVVTARGENKSNAINNAKMLKGKVLLDSAIHIPNSYFLENAGIFRSQQVELKIYLPKNQKIRLSNKVWYQISNATDNIDIWNDSIQYAPLWLENNMIQCPSCPKQKNESEEQAPQPTDSLQPSNPNRTTQKRTTVQHSSPFNRLTF